jgi:hypothetical protein
MKRAGLQLLAARAPSLVQSWNLPSTGHGAGQDRHSSGVLALTVGACTLKRPVFAVFERAGTAHLPTRSI